MIGLLSLILIVALVQGQISSVSTQLSLPDLFGIGVATTTTTPAAITTSSTADTTISTATNTTVSSTTTTSISTKYPPKSGELATTSAMVAASTTGAVPIFRTRRTAPPILVTAGPLTTTEVYQLTTTFDNLTTTVKPKQDNNDSPELTLKACCGSQCVAYDNLMSMVGLQCCGDTPINAFEKICCSNQIHVRHAGARFFDRCCGGKPYAWDQVCCRGKVYDGVPQASCCGDAPYSIYDRTSICCGEQLHKIPQNTGSAVCCGETMYDDRAGTHFCCGDRLYSRLTHNGCCHPYPGMGVEYPAIKAAFSPTLPQQPPVLRQNQMGPPSGLIRFSLPGQRFLSPRSVDRQKKAEGYNSTTQLCCDRVYEKHEYDFCCYVADVNAKQWTPPVPRPYSSKTHCCDGMTILELDQAADKTGEKREICPKR